MSAGTFRTPRPRNEPVLSYAPHSPERAQLRRAVEARSSEVVEIPCVVGGERVFTGRVAEVTNPSAHREVLARVHLAGPAEVALAAQAAEAARAEWAALPYHQRAATLLKAASLLAGPWRARVNASTLLGQGKTPHQAEIDAACELIDFWNFNVWFGEQLLAEQPPEHAPGTWNRLDHRPLDGFVFAVSPFNFTSIAANLPTAPALMGNTVLWKPALTSSAACWDLFLLLEEAGLPPGVINFLPGHGPDVGDPVLDRPELAGIHFTGSTGTFRRLWRGVAERLDRYRCWPRLVGETGGKDFILAHPSADLDALAVAVLRGAFEYQGQKCSAASRLYVPASLWPGLAERLRAGVEQMSMGDVRDFSNFLGPVIDQPAFLRLTKAQALAQATGRVITGGKARGEEGWFVEPTVVQVQDPHHPLMEEELFGPLIAAFVYDDSGFEGALDLVDRTSPYALTGAVFARDRRVLERASERLRFAAGNFYLNDKPTGAVVGQQPFGGGRASGTNDKAGSVLNLLRWTSPRTVKETFTPPVDWRYPFLG